MRELSPRTDIVVELMLFSLSSKTQLLTLYLLDSGAYSKGIFDWFGFHPTEYDWIKPVRFQSCMPGRVPNDQSTVPD